ncbi:efflux RND transporter permease subunit [Desulfuromonas acetoxidans]|uniref:efflux RND transporter permease subunit n=1 Tax=Desulfuromonas acetoxidans TaxID=891 RepID=UPI002930E100|nr:efflux RND transporter permease subunit [Desulfuromonas acetoxidans]
MSDQFRSPGEERGAIAWMAGNSVASNLLMLILMIGGLLIATQIKQEVFPEFDTDIVTVTVPYPGASPEEVEQGIILAIEEAVQGLDGVDEVTSSAREGVGVVTVELLLGADLQKLASDIESEVDRISTFPDDAERAGSGDSKPQTRRGINRRIRRPERDRSAQCGRTVARLPVAG